MPPTSKLPAPLQRKIKCHQRSNVSWSTSTVPSSTSRMSIWCRTTRLSSSHSSAPLWIPSLFTECGLLSTRLRASRRENDQAEVYGAFRTLVSVQYEGYLDRGSPRVGDVDNLHSGQYHAEVHQGGRTHQSGVSGKPGCVAEDRHNRRGR